MVTVAETAEAVARAVAAIRKVVQSFSERRQVVRVTIGGVRYDLAAMPDDQIVQALIARTGRGTSAVRKALIIANANYDDSRLAQLRSPSHDAESLVGVLGDPRIGGFEVDLLQDGDERTIRRRIAEFFADRDRDDLLVLHFSCHGVKDTRGRLHLAARDTDLSLLSATALPASFVNDEATGSHSRRIVLILDCCYSGAFARGTTVRAGSEVAIADEFGAGSGQIVLTASSATEYAFEGGDLTESEGKPSAFTSALVEGLRTGEADLDADGEVTVDELYDYVYRTVRTSTPGQAPMKWSFGAEGGLVIAKSHKIAALPAGLLEDLRNDRVALRLEAVKALAQLYNGDRPGLRASAAEKLADLRTGDDSIRVRGAAADALKLPLPPVDAKAPEAPGKPFAPAVPPQLAASERKRRAAATAKPVKEADPATIPVQPGTKRTSAAPGSKVLAAVGWLVLLKVLFYVTGALIELFEWGYTNPGDWPGALSWAAEAVIAILLLRSRKAVWGALLLGSLAWGVLDLASFAQWFGAYSLFDMLHSAAFFLIGNFAGVAALVCALVAFAPRWPQRGGRGFRLSATALVAVLSIVASTAVGSGLAAAYSDNGQAEATWIVAAVWSAAVLPLAVLATSGQRALQFTPIGWIASGAMTSQFGIAWVFWKAWPETPIWLVATTFALAAGAAYAGLLANVRRA